MSRRAKARRPAGVQPLHLTSVHDRLPVSLPRLVAGAALLVLALGLVGEADGAARAVEVASRSARGPAEALPHGGPAARGSSEAFMAQADNAPIYLPLAARNAALRLPPPQPLAFPLSADHIELSTLDMSVSGQRAYVVMGTWNASKLLVYDVQDPLKPRFLGRTDVIEGLLWGTVAADGMVFALHLPEMFEESPVSLMAFDARDPARIRRTAHISFASDAAHGQDLAIADGHLYVAAAADGLRVFDVSEPTVLREEPGLRRRIVGVEVAPEGLLLLEDVEPDAFAVHTDLLLASLAEPGRPEVLTRVGLPVNTTDVAVTGDLAVLTVLDGTLLSYAIEPGRLRRLQRWTGGDAFFSLSLGEGRIAVREERALRLFGLDAEGRFEPRGMFAAAKCSGPSVWRGDAILVAGEEGLLAVDASDPSAPTLAQRPYASRVAPQSIVLHDGHAYLPDGFRGAHIVDLGDPAAPLLLSSTWGDEQRVDALAVRSGRAYLAYYPDSFSPSRVSLETFDLSQPGQPRLLGQLPDQGWYPDDVVVAADTAYVSNGDWRGEIVRVDVSDPAQPLVLPGEGLEEHLFSLALRDGLLAGFDDELRLALFSEEPQGLRELARLDASGGAELQLSGDRAYALRDVEGLWTFDVADPEAPSVLGVYGPMSYARGLDVEGELAYVAEAGGLRVIDIADPGWPRELGVLPSATPALDVAVAEGFAYLVLQDALWVVDVRDPGAPVLVGELRFTG